MGFNRKKEMGQRPEYRGSKPDYISGKDSNPHAAPASRGDSFYSDHGRGKRKAQDGEESMTRKLY